jgi:ribonuclease E
MAAFQAPIVVFQPPDLTERRSADAGRSRPEQGGTQPGVGQQGAGQQGVAQQAVDQPDSATEDAEAGAGSSRRRRRGGRGRGKGAAESGSVQVGAPGSDTGQDGIANGQAAQTAPAQAGGAGAAGGVARSAGGDQRRSGQDRGGSAGAEQPESGHGASDEDEDSGEPGGSSSSRRRRRRRQRSGSGGTEASSPAPDDPTDTVVHVREPRPASAESDDVRAVKGSTRLEAKRQRRRESRDTGRRRPPIISESEFLARREAVERVMLVRQQGERTQIAVLEDDILVEHYVDKASSQSYVGNVYLGKVQNVLPSMEAAFVDIGKGRNAVLYAGEVNFDASGLEGVAKRIESALKSGQSIMVQVTKDPIGHKGARLTSQVSLPGRYLVYVPGASMTGISRKLPDTERSRLKQILKKVAPEEGGIIVRTAAEGASEEELQHDVTRLVAQWQAIERKAKTANAPDLLYGEPDLTIRVVRDIFNEDFTKLVIASDSEWDLVDEYVRYVAPTLSDRLERWSEDDDDLFAAYRIDEQLAKALDRKVWLPSGGSLVIDTTEAMTVIDVNTGKFTGQGGNLEQTVTRNNLEAAEEIVRQLRLRDVGGIIVIDFIDMVLESNRDLVLRRLIECLARDRTKHQVAEVTSLGLVQMTRKRVGSGLLAAFSVPCEHCNGRGVLISTELAEIPHGRNGQHASLPKPGPSRSRSARTKAIAQVAARTMESQVAADDAEAESRPAQEPVAAGTTATAGAPARSGSAKSANGGSSSGRGSSGRSRRADPAPEPGSDSPEDRSPETRSPEARDTEARDTGARDTAADGAAGDTANGQTAAQADGHGAAAAEELTRAAAGEQSPNGSALAAAGIEQAAATPRRRTRRSAYREAGPPDSVLAASASPQAPSDAQAPSEGAASSDGQAASGAQASGNGQSAGASKAANAKSAANAKRAASADSAASAEPVTSAEPVSPEPGSAGPTADNGEAASAALTEPAASEAAISEATAPEATASAATASQVAASEVAASEVAPEAEVITAPELEAVPEPSARADASVAAQAPASPELAASPPSAKPEAQLTEPEPTGATPASQPAVDPADPVTPAEQPAEG